MFDEPSGDPAGMRLKAAMLRAHADALADDTARLQSVAEIPRNVGGVADRYRDAMQARYSRLRRVTDELLGVSAELERAAARVEQAQLEYQTRLRSQSGGGP